MTNIQQHYKEQLSTSPIGRSDHNTTVLWSLLPMGALASDYLHKEDKYHPSNRSHYPNLVTPGSTNSQEYARSFHTYTQTPGNVVSPCGSYQCLWAEVRSHNATRMLFFTVTGCKCTSMPPKMAASRVFACCYTNVCVFTAEKKSCSSGKTSPTACQEKKIAVAVFKRHSV